MIPERNPYNNWSGNGQTTTFDFDFYIEDETQLIVYHTNASGVQTTLRYGADYSINEFKNKNGSFITFPLTSSSYSVLGEGEIISLCLTLPISQENEYGKSNYLDLKSIEYSFDYLTRICQIINRQMERSVKTREGSDIDTDQLIKNINTIVSNLNIIDVVSEYIRKLADYLNMRQISNCILEAPNGVWSCNGNVLTVNRGLKVLIPNGRNADGTVNNITLTLANDINYTYNYGFNLINDYVFLCADNTIARLNSDLVYYVMNNAQLSFLTGTGQYRFVYVENDNRWYYTNDYGATWTYRRMTPIGRCSVSADNNIYDGRPDYALNLASNSTLTKLLFTPFSFPSSWMYVDLALGASGSSYMAPANGYFVLAKEASSATDFIYFVSNLGLSTIAVPNIGSTNMHTWLPAQRGQSVSCHYSGTGAAVMWRFIYAKGEE